VAGVFFGAAFFGAAFVGAFVRVLPLAFVVAAFAMLC
jgi:hypothetical protein